MVESADHRFVGPKLAILKSPALNLYKKPQTRSPIFKKDLKQLEIDKRVMRIREGNHSNSKLETKSYSRYLLGKALCDLGNAKNLHRGMLDLLKSWSGFVTPSNFHCGILPLESVT